MAQTAIRTARTEPLRAYREASLGQYRQSGVVAGYLRLAAKSDRTCPACLFMDGEWFPLSVPFAEHVQGRCTPVPALDPNQAASWRTGQVWFAELDVQRQRAILGKKLHDLWRKGEIGLADVPRLHEDATWGNSWQVATLEQARAAARRRR